MTLSRIRKLSPLVINQIAAGEVIERPASVVKELLENAIDAGATQIDIRIEQAGTRSIEISDNGSGIHEDDLPVAVARHTTSKLTTDDVLAGVSTLGFRGEALASIASVARLTVASDTTGEGVGKQISLSGTATEPTQKSIDEISFYDMKPVTMSRGTQVTVKDLFFNLPARRRFLKSIAVEFGHIETVIKRLALVYFDIGFSLSHQGKVRFSVRPAQSEQDKLQRISQLMGGDFNRHAIPVGTQHDIVSVSGWLVLHVLDNKPKQAIQQIFVNGRMVQNRGLKNLLKTIASDANCLLDYVLFLQVDESSVDVNIHPTKLDVRLHDEQSVHAILRHVVSKQLSQHQVGHSVVKKRVDYGEPFYFKEQQLLTQQEDGFYWVDFSGQSDIHSLNDAKKILQSDDIDVCARHVSFDELFKILKNMPTDDVQHANNGKSE